jgi:hypothetical protein
MDLTTASQEEPDFLKDLLNGPTHTSTAGRETAKGEEAGAKGVDVITNFVGKGH